MTTFAVNPKSINPVKEKMEIEKGLMLSFKIEITEAKAITKAMLWQVNCNGSGSVRAFTYEGTYSGASAQADTLCGGAGWVMGGA